MTWTKGMAAGARGVLCALVWLAAAPAAAQGVEAEPVGEWFLYRPGEPGSPEALVLPSLGDEARGMLLVWSCPSRGPALAMVPREPPPDTRIRVTWRLDEDSTRTAYALHAPVRGSALVFPPDHTLELTRGVSSSSRLMVRLAPEGGGEQVWMYSLDQAEPALGRLACVRAARAADPSGWERRSAEASAPAAPRLVNARDAARAIDTWFDPLLRDAGVTGRVVADVALNADGTVARVHVVTSTHETFSLLGRRVARMLRFTPPAGEGATVRVRMELIHRGGSVEVVQR